ncbi:MAG: cobyrinate a,c-diamide synthase [Acetatifactor sp.]|nr:cobyrinate a,c-diamide synthase [Acetatifactor sp.]
MANPRIMLAAPRSGSGKTLITCALLQALKQRGLKVQAFKCGPDYIDPMFHKRVLDVPSRNLDLFFTGEDVTRALFLKDNDSDVSVIEGVMGLYDGLSGTSEEASAYHLAKTLNAPILLIVNCRGMGRSVLAEIAGFLALDHEKLIKGVILNQVSETFYQSIAPMIQEELKVEVFGYYPTKKELEIPSRHLGLWLPDELGELKAKIEAAAGQLVKSVCVDRILELANDAAQKNPLTAGEYAWLNALGGNAGKVRIGVAMDEAFCFYYEDNFRLLENAGAKLCFFSPMKDLKLPEDIQGLILGGGYPELRARELSENVAMRAEIKRKLAEGMPALAECGGFMYLHDFIQSPEGEDYPMAGVISGSCRNSGKLVRFGYATFQMPRSFASFSDGMDENVSNEIRGHEFHYYDSDACGEDCIAVKPVTGRNWKCGYFGDGRYLSFGHLYYPSNPGFAKWFVDQCESWRK